MRNTPIKIINTIAMDLSNLRVVILSGGGGGNEFGICAVEGSGERRMKRRRRR